jgi:chitinase
MKRFPKNFPLLYLIINYSLASENIPYRNVIYFGDWSVYDKFYPSNMDAKSITHINFAFIDIDSNGDLKFCDEYADIQIENNPDTTDDSTYYTGLFGAFSILKIKNPYLKLGISVGG